MKQTTYTIFLILILLSILKSGYCHQDRDEDCEKEENYEDIEIKYIYIMQTVTLATALIDLQATIVTGTTTLTVPTTLTDTTTANVPTTLTDTAILTLPVPITIRTTLTTTFIPPTCVLAGAPCDFNHPELCCSQTYASFFDNPAVCSAI